MFNGNEIAAQFILGTKYEILPPEVIQQSKRCLLDLLGSTLAGTLTRVGRIAMDLVLDLGGKGEATLLGGPRKVPLTSAILANSFFASALDIDDGHRLVKGHPGAFIFPAVLALAERDRKSGKEFLTATVVGYEIGIRAGMISHAYYTHYHSSGSWGGMGTFASMANLLGFNKEQILNGLGIAEFHGTIAPALRQASAPSMLKGTTGWGAFSGAFAALLAQKGFTGTPSLLGLEEYNELVRTLGKEFKILDLYFKPYASCRWAQPAIDGTLQILNKEKIHREEIKKITIQTFEEATILRSKRPQTCEEAQYSLPYAVAVAIIDGQVGPMQVLEERLNNPEILSIADKVEISYDSDIQKTFPERCLAKVIIQTRKGTYSSGLMGAKGDPDHPLSDEEMKQKFLSLTQGIVQKENAQKIIEMVDTFEKIRDVNELIHLVRAKRSGAFS